MTWWKFSHRGTNEFVRLMKLSGVNTRRRRWQRGVRGQRFTPFAPGCLTESIGVNSNDNAQEPGSHCSGIAKRTPLLPRPKHGLLRDLFGDMNISRQ